MQGAADDAALELRAATEAFRDLGAGPDLAAAERESVAAAEQSGQPVTSSMTFMFTDIVGSTTLAGSVGDEVWASILRWHDETLREQVGRGHGRVVKSTGDGLFAAFGSARDALATAIAIQRALRDHRRASGYPARVRIGLHTGEATERGGDYGGLAVHVAARVAALAGADEIVVSSAVLAAADDVPASDTRSVALKGVSEPVTVATLAWT
jgi:class 3 adenylate cyclase